MSIIKTKINFLPNMFPGFYESGLSTIIDSHEENELEYISEQLLEEYNIEVKPYELWDVLDVDYDGARKCLSEIYIDSFLELTKEFIAYNNICNFGSIKFSDLISPKYYNFETDKLEVEIELKPDVLLNYAMVNLIPFSKYLEDNFKSRDGFTSFHSHNARDWFNGLVKERSEYIYYSYMFDFFIMNVLREDKDMYYCYARDNLEYIENEVMNSVWEDSVEAMYSFVSFDIESIAKNILEERNEPS